MSQERFAQARILVLAGDSAVADALRRALVGGGYRSVVVAADAPQFTAACEAQPPDLVVLDPDVEAGTRFDVLGWLEGQEGDRPQPPILCLGCAEGDGVCETALADGTMDCLPSPFEERQLLLRAHSLLARRFLEADCLGREQHLEQLVSEGTRELRESLDRLRRVSRERHELALRIVTAQEEERRRIAAEIHDGTVQSLVALRIRLSLLAAKAPGPDIGAELAQLEATVAGMLGQMRTLLLDLRTPAIGEAGLPAALDDYIAGLRDSGGPPVTVAVETTDRAPAESESVLLRIAQEALTNARKHAAASALAVTLSARDKGILLTVRDDGRGFDAEAVEEPGHLGLTLMKERASIAGGWCRIESAPGRGTTVVAWVPLLSAGRRRAE